MHVSMFSSWDRALLLRDTGVVLPYRVVIPKPDSKLGFLLKMPLATLLVSPFLSSPLTSKTEIAC